MADPEALRISIRVKPGASRTRVGGRYGESSLVVAVTAKAVDGQATEAALRAVADAFGVPRRAVALISGATSRDKVVEVLPGESRFSATIPASAPTATPRREGKGVATGAAGEPARAYALLAARLSALLD